LIYFDTNALVALPHWAERGLAIIQRIADGEPAAISSVVWYEFLIGPVSAEEIRLARAFVRGNIVEVGAEDARLAAELYNAAGRKRTLKTDALIAACAIRASAQLLTLNQDDFRPFTGMGLQLASSDESGSGRG
jgi:predicted nucleic acid-binding protein